PLLPPERAWVRRVGGVGLLVEAGHPPVAVGLRVPPVRECVDLAKPEAGRLEAVFDRPRRKHVRGMLEADEALLLTERDELPVTYEAGRWIDPVEVTDDVHRPGYYY